MEYILRLSPWSKNWEKNFGSFLTHCKSYAHDRKTVVFGDYGFVLFFREKNRTTTFFIFFSVNSEIPTILWI